MTRDGRYYIISILKVELQKQINDREIVHMQPFVQRADDREIGGVMISQKSVSNGPARVHRKISSRLERLPPLAG